MLATMFDELVPNNDNTTHLYCMLIETLLKYSIAKSPNDQQDFFFLGRGKAFRFKKLKE